MFYPKLFLNSKIIYLKYKLNYCKLLKKNYNENNNF